MGKYFFLFFIFVCGSFFYNIANAEQERSTRTIEITNSENKIVTLLVQRFYIEQEEVLSPEVISGKEFKEIEIVIPKINPSYDGVFFQFEKQVVNIITRDTDTLLDIFFTDREGKITSILKNIKADSSEKIPSCERISAVIALKASTLDKKNIQIGDRIEGSYFVTDCSFEECADYENWQKKNPPPPQNIEECTNNLKLKYSNAEEQNK